MDFLRKQIQSARKIILSAYWLFVFFIHRPNLKKAGGERKKVLHLAKSARLSGVTVMVRNLLECTDRELFEPSVCFIEDGPLASELRDMGFDVTVLKTRDYHIEAIVMLKRLMEKNGTDMLHAHSFKESIYGRIAADIAGVPVKIVHCHGGIEGDWKKLAPFGRLSLKRTDAYIALTEIMKDDIAGGFYGYGVDPDKIRKIPNCVDTEVFFPKDKAASKKRLGLREGVPVIGMTSRLSAEKGHDVLFRALEIIKKEGCQFICVLAGTGPAEDGLKKMAAELGLSENIKFLGVRCDIPEILPAFDIGVQPSVWSGESFSLSTVEAMACGVPVVVSRVGGLPEVVDHEINGFLFDPGDAVELAGFIKKLLDDPGRSASMGRSARAKVEKDFSKDIFEKRVKLLYSSLLQNKNLPN